MASINISFDTVSKKMTASIDGKEIEDVIGVDMYPSYDDEDEFRCSIVTRREDKETNIKVFTQLQAADSNQGRDLLAKAKADVSVNYPGFVEGPVAEKCKTYSDIAGFFGVE